MPKAPDNRMLWVRNLERLADAEDVDILDCELASEAEIHGLLSFDNDAILCAPLTAVKGTDGLHKFDLSLRVARVAGLGPATRKGYLFREGLAGELAAIMSVLLQARIYVLSTTWGRISPRGLRIKQEFTPVRNVSYQRDPIIFAKQDRNFTAAAAFLEKLRQLPTTEHQRVILSFHHYNRALQEIGIDEEMLFVRLVSAVEVLAKGLTVSDDPLEGKSFSDVIRENGLSPEELEELKEMFETRKATKRFVQFLVNYSKGFFKGGKTKAPHMRITRTTLPEVAETIYGARSRYLHDGEPMYLSTVMTMDPKWHTDPTMGVVQQNRRFRPEDKLPHGHFFHRLVRHCILEYVNSRGRAG